ncbi:unnamed protein product, partial [Rotaria socialis]
NSKHGIQSIFEQIKNLKQTNLNAFIYRNLTGDDTLQTHISFSLPFKYLQYITHDLKIERLFKTGDFDFLESRLIAKPVVAHYVLLDTSCSEKTYIRIDNEIEYLRVKALCNGNDIATHSSLNAQYNPQSISQVSAIISTKFYGKEFQNSLYALFKQHQGIVRFFLNTTDNQDYAYEMDIGLDTDLLTEHTKRTNEQETAMSDIDTKKCTATGKYYRCYKGDITVRTGTSIVRRVKGKFNVNVERQGLPAIISSSDSFSCSNNP